MTKEEYTAIYTEKNKKIFKLKRELKLATEEYCRDCSPFKIGEKVSLNGKEGVITKIMVYNDIFEYRWKPFKKDGTDGVERDIHFWDFKNIKKKT